MTKTKARARAKARLAAKATKPAVKSAKPEVKVKAGKFDAKSHAMRKSGNAAHGKSAAGMMRGSARSR